VKSGLFTSALWQRRGVDGVFNPDRTMAVTAELDADLLALQEVDKRFGSRRAFLDMRRLHDECGLVPIPLRPTGSLGPGN
jgi:endonuclease/exonuclease/phosphatase family metal-dependent hydrolase